MSTAFSAFAFSLDSLLPIIDLRQESGWKFSDYHRCPELRTAVELYFLVHGLVGWFLGVLLAIAASAVAKQRD
jgi:hypothetical protein